MDDTSEDKYAVLQFPKGDISVIPTNWLIDNFCLWPTHTKNLRTSIIKRVSPGPDWKMFPYKVMDTFNNYEDALEAEKKAVATTTEDDSDDQMVRVGKRRIKKKVIPDTFSVPLLSDHEIDSGNLSDIESASSSNWGTLNEVSNKQSTTLRCNTRAKEKSGSKTCLAAVISIADEDNSPVEKSLEGTTTIVENFTAIPDEKYQLLVDMILENKTMIQMVLNKVNALNVNNGIGNLRESRKEDLLKDDLIRENLPLNTINDLLSFDDKLKTQKDVSTQLFHLLSLVGGSDYKNLLRRSLPVILTNDLAMLCSWTGQKNNFKVGDTQIMKVLKDTVKGTFPTTTGKEFEVMVAEWLRFSKQRKQREEKR